MFKNISRIKNRFLILSYENTYDFDNLLFAKAYLNDFNYKALICIDQEKYLNQDIDKSDYIFGYIFNNNIVEYYYSTVLDNRLYQISNISNIKFSLNSKFIIIELEFGNL